MILALAAAFTASAMAQSLQTLPLPFEGKAPIVKKAPVLNDDELVTVPENVTIDEDWAITGTYTNSNNPYNNVNDIAVAIEGNDIYVRGMVYLCPDAWVKGTINGSTVTFASGQYAGVYGETNIYVCGSTDGNTISDMTFSWDGSKTLTLNNFYLENTNTETINCYFYSPNIVVYKDIVIPAPGDVTVDPAAETATVAWTENGNATQWNIRYRTLPEVQNYFWDFEDESQLADWGVIDNDGDGNVWIYDDGTTISAHSGTGKLYSKSYDNSTGALTPDNWAITPEVELGGTFKFWACGQDPNYAEEVFGAFVTTDIESGNWTQLGENMTATGEWTEYSFDLSAYSGKGYLAIRHYNVTDMFYLNIDDVTVEIPGGEYPGEWNLVEGITENPYVLGGLTPETTYELQVQSVANEASMTNAEDDMTSAWSESVEFTTTSTTGIDTIEAAETNSNVWYNLAGMKLNGQPTERGIYINNGKKVVIR